ncbi:MAG: polyphosphate kinase, partial [Pseudomonadota bacterium]|nr:polyphosphate kinase [Pseudomonadota bacterium]
MAREKASVAAKPRVAKTSGAAAAPAKKTSVKSANSAVARPANKAAPAAPVRGRSKPRPAAAGDIGPISGQPKIEAHAVVEAVTAAQEARLAAMRDIISGAPTGEAASLLATLLRQQRVTSSEENPDDELMPDWREGGYPYRNLMQRRNYERQKYRLQVELLKLQAWVKETGQKVVILFEGRDAAGKGGTIKRFMEHLNPRGARVVALEKPTEVERGQWYFQRYVQHLPTSGEIVLLDRSWYNRAGVERVMGFCTDNEYVEFMRQVPEFERMLARQGVHLIKFWFSVSREEQRRRFKERKVHPLKQWKLSPIDMASLDKWE